MFENLGEKLKNTRMKNHLSRKQVAELIGISVSMVGFYECGERLPSLPILVKLATCYKVSIDYLLDHDIAAKNTLSLDGLTDDEIQVLKFTAEHFRNSNKTLH
ncbi:MAG: helix-turn-helix transcriptional regulator [Lachnospiraceae bacterium]|nr:helix-turn-helix transcriptional regulator [Lachnospiraceae bacterium]